MVRGSSLLIHVTQRILQVLALRRLSARNFGPNHLIWAAFATPLGSQSLLRTTRAVLRRRMRIDRARDIHDDSRHTWRQLECAPQCEIWDLGIMGVYGTCVVRGPISSFLSVIQLMESAVVLQYLFVLCIRILHT